MATPTSPLLIASKKRHRPARPAREKTTAASTTGPLAARELTVLVVDDVEDTRSLYRHYFEYQGARVFTAADGMAALDLAVAEQPDVIVLDLAMPRMTGWDVLGALKNDARTHAIPVLVLSGQGAPQTALEAGADRYLEKPCLPPDLLSEVLRLRRAQGARDQ
jgi:CheY-like chemotaxis protein